MRLPPINSGRPRPRARRGDRRARAVSDPRTIHQSKFSMGFVLALIAARGSAGIDDFTEEALEDPELRGFSERVEMVFDPEVDAAYPRRWIGLVEIETPAGEDHLPR